VQLGSQPYQHPKYGQIFNPVLNIVDWSDMDLKQRLSAVNGGASRKSSSTSASANSAG